MFSPVKYPSHLYSQADQTYRWMIKNLLYNQTGNLLYQLPRERDAL